MDLVSIKCCFLIIMLNNIVQKASFETADEWNFVRSMMSSAGIREIWTAGRLCDAEVCTFFYFVEPRVGIIFIKDFLKGFIGVAAFAQGIVVHGHLCSMDICPRSFLSKETLVLGPRRLLSTVQV